MTNIGISEQIKQTYMEYQRLEGRLYTLLDKLVNNGQECDCQRPERISLRDETAQVDFCASCGGYVEPKGE